MNTGKIIVSIALLTPFLVNAKVIHVSSLEEFNNNILTSDKPIVVKFGSQHCGACVRSAKPFENASNDPQLADVIFVEIDSLASPELTEQYKIRSLPTFLYIHKGQVVDSKSGFSENLKNEINSTISRIKSSNETVEQNTQEQPEASADSSATCPVVPTDTVLTRAVEAILNFFSSITDTIRGWFK